MSLTAKIRSGKGPFWGTLKALARGLLLAHVPVGPLTRPLFGALYRVHVGVRAFFRWAVRFFWYEPLFRSQCHAIGKGFEMEKLPAMSGRGRLVIGDRVWLSGKPAFQFSNRVHADPELVIGNDTFIGYGCIIHVASSVRIGAHCLLARGIEVADFDGHPLDAERRRANDPPRVDEVRPVVIGDDVWIGARAIILKGVTIGDRSVVGAAAVVTRDVPADVVVAGNPARIVKQLSGNPEADKGERLAAIGMVGH